MLKTDLITPYIVPKTEEQNREEKIKKILDNFNSFEITGYENERKFDFDFLKKVWHEIDESRFLNILATILIFSFPIISEKNISFSASVFLFICYVIFLLFLSSALVLSNFSKSIRAQENFKKQILDLFSNLAEQNFEIRAEFLESGKKLKVIVEENKYIEGTNSVIKTSSKSITAYINTTEDKDSIIRSVVSLVKAAEEKFA